MTLHTGLFHDSAIDYVSALDGTTMEDSNTAVDKSQLHESWRDLGSSRRESEKGL